MKLSTAVLALALTPGQVEDHELSLAVALEQCALIENDNERLVCYDAAAVRLGIRTAKEPEATPRLAPSDRPSPAAADPSRPTGDIGQWTIDSKINPLDDSRTIVLSLKASQGVNSRGTPPVLVFRCQSGKAEAWISWFDYLGSSAFVTARIDDGKPTPKEWSLSTNSQATFYPGNDAKWIRRLTRSGRLVAQVTPYNENPVTAVFELAGLSTAIEPLAAICKLPD